MTKTVFTDSQNIFVSGGPFKTESKKEKFPPKITLQNTKKGFRKLYELVMDLSNIQVIPYGEFIDYLAREGDPRDIEINMDGISIFIPIMNDVQRELLLSKILDISRSIFPKKRLKSLQNLAEKSYIYSSYDSAEKVAFNTYRKMTDERKSSKNGRELEHYLIVMSKKILCAIVETQDVKALNEFLDFGFASQKTLEQVFDELCDDVPVVMKAYLLEQISKERGISDKTETETFSV